MSRQSINVQTGEIEILPDAPPSPQPIPPTAAEILAEKQAAYDVAMENPAFDAIIEAVADAVTAGVPIDKATLRSNGRSKIT